MSDEKLLSALGRMAAGQAADRERREARAADGHGAEGASDQGGDEELARRLFAPASAASVERMTARVVEQLASAPRSPAAVVPIRRRILKWAGVAVVPLAAAAAFALFVARPEAALPGYTLSVTGGARADRGAETRGPSDPVAVAPHTQIVLLARPDARASGSVHTATFLVRAGAAVPVPSVSEASEKGALRVTVLGDDVAKAAEGSGVFDLVLVVSRAADVDSRAWLSGAPSARDLGHGEWARFTVPVRVPDPGH